MIIYTKESLITRLREIREQGWIESGRPGNDGGIGNTLEDLLGLQENNLPIPNAAEWELKCQKLGTTSLLTLFHLEPSPRALKFVPQILLPYYGWTHAKAGNKYPSTEKSFRQTINAVSRTDRGFGIQVDFVDRKIIVSFDASSVSSRHSEWLASVKDRVGLAELNPQPYWGFDDLYYKAGTKLSNCFYIQAEVKKENSKNYFFYKNIFILQKLSLKSFIQEINQGNILIDFDARTGKNHGVKFRLRKNKYINIYQDITEI